MLPRERSSTPSAFLRKSSPKSIATGSSPRSTLKPSIRVGPLDSGAATAALAARRPRAALKAALASSGFMGFWRMVLMLRRVWRSFWTLGSFTNPETTTMGTSAERSRMASATL